ncbi:MAG: PIN domain-containing protein [Chloroflexi bacterium]|nr:PIN domain-containing protein [Chloroflexota bacterium]
MIAVDTNILVHAHRSDSEFNAKAMSVMVGLAEGAAPWAIPWPCIHEFVAITTNARIFRVPSPIEAALAQVTVWLESPSATAIGEGPGYFDHFARLATSGRAAGGVVHDARIAALCVYWGVDELWTGERDFARFPELRVMNPLASS